MTLPFPVPTAAPDKSADKRRPRSETLLEGLNDAQQAAVSHPGGPLLVVAGAGSGKTRVLTRRIAWLIAARGAHPGSILAITFTNKAAAEMRERVADLVGPRARMMWVSTFHSACVRILRREASKFGFTSSFTIYDAADQRRLMTLICRDMDLDPKRINPRAASTGSPTSRTSSSTTSRQPARPTTRPRRSTPRPTRPIRRACRPPTRWTSTTSS